MHERFAIRARHQLDRVGRQTGSDQPRRDCNPDGAIGQERFFAAAQDASVARLEAQRSSVGGNTRASFVHHGDHTEWNAHARNLQAVGPRFGTFDATDEIGHRCDLFDRRCQGRHTFVIEAQSIDHRGCHAAFGGRGDVVRVGPQDIGGAAANGFCDRAQRRRALFRTCFGHHARGRARLLRELRDLGGERHKITKSSR